MPARNGFPLWVRYCHFFNFVFLMMLIRSGLSMLLGFCGYAAFALTMAATPPVSTHPGIDGPTVLAAALALSATGAFMVLFRVSYPPAGATTLIVSHGGPASAPKRPSSCWDCPRLRCVFRQIPRRRRDGLWRRPSQFPSWPRRR